MSENKQLTKKPSIISTFLGGCYRGFEVGIKNIVPAMILGYTLVYILQATGVMDLLGSVLSPVMGVFGLPGEAVAVLISAFFAKAAGCGQPLCMPAAFSPWVRRPCCFRPVSSWEPSLVTMPESCWWPMLIKNGTGCFSPYLFLTQ